MSSSAAGSRIEARRSFCARLEVAHGFPAAHWRKLRSTNPLERFNKEIGRRTDVVGIFPDDQSLVRLAGMLCIRAKRLS